jgi:hypothetical protein
VKELVDRSGLKGQPLVPKPVVLEDRVKEGMSADQLFNALAQSQSR